MCKIDNKIDINRSISVIFGSVNIYRTIYWYEMVYNYSLMLGTIYVYFTD